MGRGEKNKTRKNRQGCEDLVCGDGGCTGASGRFRCTDAGVGRKEGCGKPSRPLASTSRVLQYFGRWGTCSYSVFGSASYLLRTYVPCWIQEPQPLVLACSYEVRCPVSGVRRAPGIDETAHRGGRGERGPKQKSKEEYLEYYGRLA